MAISKRLRFEVFKRDGYTCQYCGASAPETVIQVDHIVPVSLGGRDEPANLLTACVACNSGKGSSSGQDAEVAPVDLVAVKWAKAIQATAEDRRRYRKAEKVAHDSFRSAWPFNSIPDDWKNSLTNFVRMGLTADDLLHFLAQAYERTEGMDWCWKYFCKVSWSEVRAIRERAAAVLEEEPPSDAGTHGEQVCPLLEAMADGSLPVPYRLEEPPWFEPNYREVEFPCAECDERPIYDQGLCMGCLRRQYDNYDGTV